MRRLLLALTVTMELIFVASPGALAAAPAASALLPIERATAIVLKRYSGQVVAVDVKPGARGEHAELVYEFRLLTDRGDILAVDVDALDGRIVETEGRGLVAARRLP